MNIKFLSLSALALSLALTHVPALAHGNMCEHKQDWVLKVSEKLGLSTEQQDKIKALAEKAHSEVKAKRDALQSIHRQINDAFGTNDITASKIDSFVSQEQQIMGDILKSKLQERYDAYQVLDDKQKSKMNSMVKDWEMKHNHPCGSY